MSEERRILITDDLHPLLKQGLAERGFVVHDMPTITAAEVLDIIQDYEGLVINSKVYVGKAMLDKAEKLKFVCRAGSGLEVIDVHYAASKNIAAINSPEGNRNAVAEHALGMLLGIMNNIAIANTQVKKREWKREENRGNELSGKTVGLIAYGHTAQAFAKVLRGFDVTILAYDKYYHGFADRYVYEASLQDIFDNADVLSLHLPLTSETAYMVNYDFLSRFRKPYWLVNTSRGKVLHTKDLVTCLSEEKVIAAALDVLENEKIKELSTDEQDVFDRLILDKRILLTPHIAGWTHESKRKIAEVLLRKILKLYGLTL